MRTLIRMLRRRSPGPRGWIAVGVLSLGFMAPPPASANAASMCVDHAYVANSYRNTVSIIDTNANQVVATLPMQAPYNPVIAPDGQHVYVPNTTGAAIAVIDVRTNSVASNLKVGDRPTGLIFTPDGKQILVTLLGETIDDRASLRIVDLATGEMSPLIQVGRAAERVTVSPDGRRAYVVNRDSSLTVIDVEAQGVIGSIALRDNAFNTLVSHDGKKIYAVMRSANQLAVINTDSNEVEHYVPVDAGPVGLALSGDHQSLYITSNTAGTIQEFSLKQRAVIRSERLSAPPGIVRVSPDGLRAYIAHSTSTYVGVLDLATFTEVAKIDTGGPTSLDVC